MRRLLAVVALTFGVLFVAAGPASADLNLPPIPGVPPGLPIPGSAPIPSVDCTADVPIGSPAAGPANNVDPGPAHPNTGDPFGANPDATIYEVYGYGGLNWPSLQDGCSLGVSDSVAHPGDSAAGTVANIGLTGLSLAVGIIAMILRFAFSPNTLDILDPVLSLGSRALGDNIFKVLFWVPLFATGLLIVFRATKARLPEALQGAGWVIMAGLAAVIAMTWPLTLAPLFDDALTTAVGTVNSTVANATGDMNLDAADGTAANLHRALLYETWCSGMVGKSDGPTADEFCPQLFATSTFSRSEWAEVQKDPSKASDLAAKKSEAFKAVAAKLKEKDPAAYEYLNGQHNSDRIWYCVVGWFGLLCAGGFLLMAALLLLYGLIVVRLAIILTPAAAVIGGFPPLRHKLTGLFDYTAGALITALIFGSLSAVFVAMIGAFMGPNNVLPPVLTMVLLLIVTIAAWKFSKPFRKVQGLAGIKRKQGLGKGSNDRPQMPDEDGRVPKAPSGSGGIFAPSANPDAYAGTSPAEAHRPGIVGASLKGAAEGAAISAVAGLVTGGTATAAGMAAGAARGAAGAATANAMAAHAAQPAPARPHALPAGSEPAPRVYRPGESTANVRTVEPTITDTGEHIYPIYTPGDDKAML